MKQSAQHSISLTAVFLIHALVLVGLVQQMRVPKPAAPAISQASINLFLYAAPNQIPPQWKIKQIRKILAPAPRVNVARSADQVIAEVARPIPIVALGNQDWGTSSWQSTSPNLRLINSGLGMQPQLARQRAAHAASITAALSAISQQLAPIISANIVCHQAAEDQLECTPAPNENERALIADFFKLAIEAHGLGIAENPVHITFSDTLGVSAVLQQ